MSGDTTGEPSDRRWHIDRSIQLGHVVTTLTVAISAVVYLQKLEQRVALSEQEIRHLAAKDVDHEQALLRVAAELNRRLDRIEAKLDSLAERKPR